MSYKLIRNLIVITLVLAVTIQPNNTARAVTCSGNGCNNTNPSETGCNADAATVRTKYPASGLARVQLRFSDTCQTRWARTINIGTLNYYANATLRYWYYYALAIAPGYNIYSNQRYGSGYRACGDVGSSPMNYLINDIARCTGAY